MITQIRHRVARMSPFTVPRAWGTGGQHRRYCFMKQDDPLNAAIDEKLASADGDVHRALRAVLKENLQLEAELRHLYAASEHGKPAKARCLH
jgi:hypothetical protein